MSFTSMAQLIDGLVFTVLLGAPWQTHQASEGVWISAQEIRELPMEGEAWRALRAMADKPLPPADLAGRDNNCDVACLAKALVHVRTGEVALRDQVLVALQDVVASERAGDVLSLGRNLPGYVIAADLLELPKPLEKRFRSWLELVLNERLAGVTLREVHERRPNNWGTHAGAARAVVARYLGKTGELERVAQVFRGWLGERTFYDGFEFGDLEWQADPEHPVGINPRGAVRDGHSIDGVLPDDQRRGGPFSWPPPKENYVYEALQGALVQAVVLWRAGYDVWEWGDRALLRAAQWLEHEADFPAQGDDTWQPYVIHHFYGVKLHFEVPSRCGKNMGWTDWTLPPLARKDTER
jgi:hypothetical protein